jgi:transposase InsO family protein
MGWSEESIMSIRREFARLAGQEGANVRELCRRYGISPTTGYKWIERAGDPAETYQDRSRRPAHSPNRTDEATEQLILALRDKYPFWNARKIRHLLRRELGGEQHLPAASTVGQILKRHGRVRQEASAAVHQWHRFEHDAPNELSQIDFKGSFQTRQGRCYPLTMIDDHSRFSQILKACTNEQTETVRAHLIDAFRRFGLPKRMNMDNGNPWGNPTGDRYTKLTVWLIRLGVGISHSRPLHPQTNGKDERFHRTLKVEVLGNRWFSTIAEVQKAFDRWRETYNQQRPHEALGLEVPASRYRASVRCYPEVLAPIDYHAADVIRSVRPNGQVSFDGSNYFIGQAFAGEKVALRPTAHDGVWDVFFCHERISMVDLRASLANDATGESSRRRARRIVTGGST